MRITGAHVVVTGASRGLGRSLAQVMAERGAKVTLVARNAAKLGEVADQVGGVALPTDLSNLEQLDGLRARAEEAHGPIDLLINNAAINLVGPFAGNTATELRGLLTTNLLTPLELTRALLPEMIARGHGGVVNVSSLGGEIALRAVIPYGAAKAGLAMATRALQRELRGTNVLALLIVLGLVDTDMADELNDDAVGAALFSRFGMIKPIPPKQVANRIANGIERDRKVVVIPSIGTPAHSIRQIPSRLIDLTMFGSPPTPAVHPRTPVTPPNSTPTGAK